MEQESSGSVEAGLGFSTSEGFGPSHQVPKCGERLAWGWMWDRCLVPWRCERLRSSKWLIVSSFQALRLILARFFGFRWWGYFWGFGSWLSGTIRAAFRRLKSLHHGWSGRTHHGCNQSDRGSCGMVLSCSCLVWLKYLRLLLATAEQPLRWQLPVLAVAELWVILLVMRREPASFSAHFRPLSERQRLLPSEEVICAACLSYRWANP
jgi:hypothetical protein